MEGAPHESHPSLLELPEELRPVGVLLVKALHTGVDIPQAFADFCGKAYVKRDWAGGASEFLVTLFEDHQDLLAEMARIPDLIIELSSGHQSLTCMVAYRWAAQSDTTRLSRLAEALAATQSKMCDPEVVHIMLALVTSLAITRYSRAEQMMAVAEPQAKEEHQEGLQEAKLWLAAGRIVCSCGQESRDIWDHRLRRKRTAWSWDSPAECAALAELELNLTPDLEGASLFQAITPPDWWSLAVQRAIDQIERSIEPETAQSEPAPEPKTALKPASPEPVKAAQMQQAPVIIVWNAWPFFAGGLVGASVVALMIWVTPWELTKPVPPKSTVAAAPAISKAGPAEVKAAAAKPAAPNTSPAKPDEIKLESSDEAWRLKEAARMSETAPELQALFDKICKGAWAEHEALLSGSSAELPKEDPRYEKLLIWLHIDPPDDSEIRTRLPGLLAALRPTSDTLSLWEKLSYEGSPMKLPIQAAARRQLHENKDAWSASQEQDLSRLAW
jgi:hypothetical protein